MFLYCGRSLTLTQSESTFVNHNGPGDSHMLIMSSIT